MLLDIKYGALASGLGPFRVLFNEPLTYLVFGEGAGANNFRLVLVLGAGPWPWNRWV